MLLMSRVLSLRVLEPGFRLLSSTKNKGESLLLGTLSLCSLLLVVSGHTHTHTHIPHSMIMTLVVDSSEIFARTTIEH